MARKLGLKKGDSVLEPSAGIGRIAEGDKDKSFHITQLEQNPVSAKINAILNPHTEVLHQPFEKLFMGGKLGNEAKTYSGKQYDLVIGNPPYGDYLSKYKGMGEGAEHSRWEDYFIERGLDTLREGGHMIMLIPSSFLSKAKDKIREKIAGKAKLVDAYRLPRGIFAGSNIGTDIIVLQKAKGGKAEELANDDFFSKHPENVLGQIKTRRRGRKVYVEVDGPFSNVERIGHKLSELTKQKISQALRGNKNAAGKRPTTRIKPEINKKIEVKQEANNAQAAKATLAKTTKKTKKTKTASLVDKMLQDYDFGEEQGSYDLHSFHQKYHSNFSKEDLALWSSVQADGSINMDGHKFDPNTMSVFQGNAMPDTIYASGNIRNKLDQLEREKKELDKKQYAKQKKLLEAKMPKQKKARQIHFSPLASFVRNFQAWEEGEEPEHILDKFQDWLHHHVGYEELQGVSSYDIAAYIAQEPVRKTRGESKENAQERRSQRRRAAERLFNTFVREALDEKTRKRLVDDYNRIYNSTVRPDYKKIPIFLEGLSKSFKTKELELKEHQLEGLAFMASSGKGVIAYDVGLGKTMLGIANIMQSLQRGWCKKPMLVVPKAVMRNWVREFKDLFPDAKINVLGNLGKDYVKDPEKLQIADGTISILSYEGMKRIGYNDATLTELTRDLQDVMSAGLGSEELTARQKQKRKEAATVLSGKVQKGARFLMEDMGFDHLTIDEAHNMKNVFERAAVQGDKKKANEFRYLQGASSERGVKAFLHSQYIQKNNKGRNTTLLTATPFTNSPIEIYSMLSHVARDKLQEKGLKNLNDFIATFVDLQSEYVIKGNGKIEMQDVAKGFQNLQELQELVRDAIDFKTGEEVGIERPSKEEHLVELPLTKEQRAIIHEAERAYILAQHNLRDDPAGVLRAIDIQRKATLSPKLITGKGHFVKDSPRLLFTCDAIAKAYTKKPNVGQVMYLPRGVDYYPEVKSYLVEQGLPAQSIAFLHGQTSDQKKQDIMDDFNDPNGKTKIIIGSETITEGVNLQANTSVLYNTFLGWNPTELEQLRGRIWRQGNKQKNVNIVYPVNVDSIDSVMYQKHDEKSKRIAEIWNFKGDYVNVSPIDPFETKYALIKDPNKRAEFKMQLETDEMKVKAKELASQAARVERIQESYKEGKTQMDDHQEKAQKFRSQIEKTEASLKQAEGRWKEAKQKKKSKEELSDLEENISDTKDDFKYYRSLERKAQSKSKKSKEMMEASLEQLKAMGIADEQAANKKVTELRAEETTWAKKIEELLKNKPVYLEQAKKEIMAMQRPVSSVEDSVKKMASKVLGDIRKTETAIAKEERFAASYTASFLKARNRKIIYRFLESVRND